MKGSVGSSPLFLHLKFQHPCSVSGLPSNPHSCPAYFRRMWGSLPLVVCRLRSPGDDGRMSGHRQASEEGHPAVAQGTQMEVRASPALCRLGICSGRGAVRKEK